MPKAECNGKSNKLGYWIFCVCMHVNESSLNCSFVVQVLHSYAKEEKDPLYIYVHALTSPFCKPSWRFLYGRLSILCLPECWTKMKNYSYISQTAIFHIRWNTCTLPANIHVHTLARSYRSCTELVAFKKHTLFAILTHAHTMNSSLHYVLSKIPPWVCV